MLNERSNDRNLRYLPCLPVVCALCLVFCNESEGQSQLDARANAADALRQQLSVLASAVPPPERVGREAERDLEFLGKFPAIRRMCEDAEKEYAAEIATKVQPYRNLVGTIGYTRERISTFEDAIKAYASPASIQEDADAIVKSANQSVEYQAPAYFKPGNDIDRRTVSMKLRLKVLEVLRPNSNELAQAKALATKTTEEVRKIQMKLLEGILAQNELPSDQYTKGDRKDLLKLVEETWLKQSPNDKPIRIGLIGSDWVRTEAWEVQNLTITKIDRSRLQGFVVLPNDSKTVVVRHVQLHRDHTNQDKTTAWSLCDAKAPIEPTELLLRSNLK
jgi:hypothetical protein